MSNDNIVKFPTNEVAPPSEEIMDSLAMGRPLKGIITIVLNDENCLSTYMDGLNQFEAIAVLEIVKNNTLSSDGM